MPTTAASIAERRPRAPTKTRLGLRRRSTSAGGAAIQATTATHALQREDVACGASATAEWMNVPPGTWTAEMIAEKANRRTA